MKPPIDRSRSINSHLAKIDRDRDRIEREKAQLEFREWRKTLRAKINERRRSEGKGEL